MSNASRLATNSSQDTTPSVQLNALATIYRRAVERYEEADAMKKAAERLPSPDGRDNAKEIENGCAANGSIP